MYRAGSNPGTDAMPLLRTAVRLSYRTDVNSAAAFSDVDNLKRLIKLRRSFTKQNYFISVKNMTNKLHWKLKKARYFTNTNWNVVEHSESCLENAELQITEYAS